MSVLEKKPILLSIHVSLAILNQMSKENAAADDLIMNRSFMSVPVVLELNYRDDWWSEHFKDRVILHTSEGTTEIPN